MNFCLKANTIVVASSSMSLYSLECYLRDLPSDLISSIYLITTSSINKTLIPLHYPNILYWKFNMPCFFSSDFHHRLSNFILSAQCSQVVFLDFSHDFNSYLVLKTVLRLDIIAFVVPSAPFPNFSSSLISSLLTHSITFKKLLTYSLLRLFGYPVRLFKYASIINNHRIASYIRIFDKRLNFLPYSGLPSLIRTAALPDFISYLYIENCEHTLSKNTILLIKSMLTKISLLLSLRSTMLFIKPRPGSTIFQTDLPSGCSIFDNSSPCEYIDMSSATLITIGSIGALARFECSVISLAQLLLNSDLTKGDYREILLQLSYVNQFNHPKLTLPQYLSDLELFDSN